MLLRFNYWGCLLLGSTFPLNWATYFFLFCLFISCCWLKIRPFSLIWLIDLLQQSSSSTRQIDLCEIFVFTLFTVHKLVYQSLSLPLNQPETVRKMFSLAGQSNQNCLWFGCPILIIRTQIWMWFERYPMEYWRFIVLQKTIFTWSTGLLAYPSMCWKCTNNMSPTKETAKEQIFSTTRVICR